MKPRSVRGKTKATRSRSQPIASILRGATTVVSEGLTCELGTGVAADIAVVVVAVTAGVTALLDCDWAAVLSPPVKVKTNCASTPIKTSVVAKRSGFSERAGVTRYQCPSHIAVITPPRARADAKKLPTAKASAGPDAANGRKIIPNTNNVTTPARTSRLPKLSRTIRIFDQRVLPISSSSCLNFPSTPAFLSIKIKIINGSVISIVYVQSFCHVKQASKVFFVKALTSPRQIIRLLVFRGK